MRRKFQFLTLVVSLVLCLTASAFGQETTGELQGTVKDQSGAVIPNVAVTIKGTSIGFSRTVQTDDKGFFSARQIPPGVYTVSTAASSGFTAQVKKDIQVGIGTATTVDFEATTGGVSAEVNITDSGVMIDATETKAQDNISAREIEALPKGTGFTSLLRTTAAVRPEPLSGQFSINGSTGPENSFIIDGQETQNYKNGLLNTNNDIPYQALQEIQVKSSGFEAEFGGATGGVINGVTKSGSNDFHGEFGFAFSPQKLNAGPRAVQAVTQTTQALAGNTGQILEYLPQSKDSGNSEFPIGLLSGPIVKDRLWFFAVHAPRVADVTRTTTYIEGVGATRQLRQLSSTLQALGATPIQKASSRTIFNYTSLRLDGSPFDSLRVSSSFTYNPIVQKGALLGGSLVNGSPSTAIVGGQTIQGAQLAAIQGGRQNSNNFRIEGIWTPTSNTVVDVRYTRGFQNQKLGSYGIASGPRIICQTVPAGLVAVAGCSQGFQNINNNDKIVKDISLRTTIDANVSYLFEAGGRHELKGGWQRSKIFNDVSTGSVFPSGGDGRAYLYYGVTDFDCNFTYVQWHIQCGNYPKPTLPAGVSIVGTGVNYQFGASGSATNTANTFYFQDKWQPTSRLTLNLGVRLEEEQIPAFNAVSIDLKFPYKDKIAPRLGAAYALTADGKTKISAFYGRFFDRLKFSLPQGSFGGQFYHVSYFYITSDKPFSAYSVANLHGNYNFPAGGQCPITLAGPNSYVCDQDYRIASNVPGADVFGSGAVDPNVKPFRQSEYTFEFQREVARATVFTGRFLYRNLDQAVEDAGIFSAAGEAYVIGNPGAGLHLKLLNDLGYKKVAVPERKYKALQLEVDSRFVKNFNFNANYTFSRLRGNYSGLAGPDELTAAGGSRNDPNVLRDFDLPHVGFTATGQEAKGLLPLDRTHVVKASGTYSHQWMGRTSNTTDVSFFTTAQSGTPKTSFINIFFIPIPETTRGDLGRTPTFTQTDLSFTHRYRFGSDDRFAVAFDFNVLNVLNQNTVLAVNQNKHSGYFGYTTGITGNYVTDINTLTSSGVLAQYQAAEAAFCINPAAPSANTCGTGVTRNAAFNQPISWQDPRSVRFGFRFQF